MGLVDGPAEPAASFSMRRRFPEMIPAYYQLSTLEININTYQLEGYLHRQVVRVAFVAVHMCCLMVHVDGLGVTVADHRSCHQVGHVVDRGASVVGRTNCLQPAHVDDIVLYHCHDARKMNAKDVY